MRLTPCRHGTSQQKLRQLGRVIAVYDSDGADAVDKAHKAGLAEAQAGM